MPGEQANRRAGRYGAPGMNAQPLSAAAVRKAAVLGLLVLACAQLGVPARAAAAGAWCGTYAFDGAAGHTAGGSPITYRYTLVVRALEDVTGCRLRLEGFQQDESLRCVAAGDAHSLRIAFVSYAHGGVTNAYGVQVYQPGDDLFALERAANGTHSSLRTTWAALHPDGLAGTGQFFLQTARCNHVP